MTRFLCADGVLALRLLVARHGVMAGAMVAGRLWTREGYIRASKSNGDVQQLDATGLKLLNDLHKAVHVEECFDPSAFVYRMPAPYTDVSIQSTARFMAQWCVPTARTALFTRCFIAYVTH